MSDQPLAVAEEAAERPKTCTPTMAKVRDASEGWSVAREMSQAEVPMRAMEAPMAPAPSAEARASPLGGHVGNAQGATDRGGTTGAGSKTVPLMRRQAAPEGQPRGRPARPERGDGPRRARCVPRSAAVPPRAPRTRSRRRGLPWAHRGRAGASRTKARASAWALGVHPPRARRRRRPAGFAPGEAAHGDREARCLQRVSHLDIGGVGAGRDGRCRPRCGQRGGAAGGPSRCRPARRRGRRRGGLPRRAGPAPSLGGATPERRRAAWICHNRWGR